MKPIVIAKTGNAMESVSVDHGEYEDWIVRGMGTSLPVEVVRVFEGETMPDPSEAAGVVVTGSASMVSERAPWSERTAEWLAAAVGEGDGGPPVLGICYGHQLLAHALGGHVGPNPNGRSMGTTPVRFDAGGDALLESMPAEALFQVSHVEAVLELPDEAVRLATTERDGNHAFRFGPRAWGIQFHPEFDEPVMRGYVRGREAILAEEGFDPEAMIREVRPTPQATPLLERFARLVADSQD